MGYLVESSGRITLPAGAEAAALATARERMLAVPDSGWLHSDEETSTLAELADFAAGAELVREGADLLVGTSDGSDPKWSDQARAFWEGLAQEGATGRVDFRGEDGSHWSYLLHDGALTQTGRNDWDGTGEGYGWEGGGAFADPDEEDDERWPPGPRATLRDAVRFTPEEQARRAKRYLGFGGLATIGGLGLLAADRPTGWFALGVGVVDLVIGLRARAAAARGRGSRPSGR